MEPILQTMGCIVIESSPPHKSHITCFKCGKMGHYANECKKEASKKEEVSGDQHLTKGVWFDDSSDDKEVNFIFVSNGTEEYDTQLLSEQQKRYLNIPSTWVLLDSQSTMDVFYNPQLVRNIWYGEHQMNIHCMAGVTTTDLVIDLPGYGTVWFHPNGIATSCHSLEWRKNAESPMTAQIRPHSSCTRMMGQHADLQNQRMAYISQMYWQTRTPPC